jgi:hypothetical protein
MRDNAGLFGLPQSLIDAVKEVQEGSAEYQNKVKAHMAKKGIKSLGDLSPEEKKKFFSDLDAAHKAKNEEVEIEESDLPSSKEKQKTVMVVHKTSGKELKIQASALDKYKAMGYKLMEEVEDVEEAESHQSKTTMKHISNPTAGEKKAAKDIKPGIAGYRDRIAMLKSAKARGALKEDGTEIEEADDKKKAMASRIAAKLNSKASKMNADRAKTLDAMKRGQGEKGKNYLLSKNEEVEIEEGKSSTGYELYHKDFSSAMAHAYDFAKKKYNIEIDPFEIDRKVAMGPKKPSSGKSNAYRLLDKTGKKAVQVQVANLDNQRYELNMYKEDLDEQKNDLPFDPDPPKKKSDVVPGKHGSGPSMAKHLAKMALKKQMDKKKIGELQKEDFVVDEQGVAEDFEVEEIDETPKVDQGLSGKQKVAARAARRDDSPITNVGNTTGGQWRGKTSPSPYKDSNVAKSGERKGMVTKSAIRKTKDAIKSRLNKEEFEEIDEKVVKGKGYDNPENERKAPEGKVPFTSFQQGKQGDLAARLHATSAKGKFVKGKAQSAPQKEPQKESYELTPEDIEFINSLNEKQ